MAEILYNLEKANGVRKQLKNISNIASLDISAYEYLVRLFVFGVSEGGVTLLKSRGLKGYLKTHILYNPAISLLRK